MVKISKRGSMDAFIVIDAGIKCMRDSTVSYTDPMGDPELRSVISKHYKDKYAVEVNQKLIVVTPGSFGAFSLSFLACFEHGCRVAMAMPCYPSYKRILESFGAEVVPLMSTIEDKYQPTVSLLKEAMKTGDIDGIIVASPNNPTGTVLSFDEQKKLFEFCDEHNIRVISDELYHGVEFGNNKPTTAINLNDNAIIINSFSKFYCMTGWRLGWMIIPDNMIETINNLQSNLFICASAISQSAAVKAFDCNDELNSNIIRYEKNRDLFVKELTDMGITKFAYPEGGFYLYADISHLTDDSSQWANDLLEEANVAVSSGMDFDPYRGKHTVRFSYVCDTDHAVSGLKALRNYLGK